MGRLFEGPLETLMVGDWSKLWFRVGANRSALFGIVYSTTTRLCRLHWSFVTSLRLRLDVATYCDFHGSRQDHEREEAISETGDCAQPSLHPR